VATIVDIAKIRDDEVASASETSPYNPSLRLHVIVYLHCISTTSRHFIVCSAPHRHLSSTTLLLACLLHCDGVYTAIVCSLHYCLQSVFLSPVKLETAPPLAYVFFTYEYKLLTTTIAVDLSTQASSGSGIDCIIKLSPSLRARPPTTIICKDSPASVWVNFLKDDVLPLLKKRENNITIYHSPIVFNAKARDNYINYLKSIMEEVPEKERHGLKELIDEYIWIA